MYSTLALTIDLSTGTPYLVAAGIAFVIALIFRYLWKHKEQAKVYLPIVEDLLKRGAEHTEDDPDAFDMHDAISIVHNLAHYASQTVNDPDNVEWADIKDEVVAAVKDGLQSTPYAGKLSDQWLERIAAGALIAAEHLPKIAHGKMQSKKEITEESDNTK